MRNSHKAALVASIGCIALSARATDSAPDGAVAAADPGVSATPNILVIWGDDIGYWNVSAYNHGMMGYQTPNIDRIAKEGALFTDAYGEQSCTAGRSAFITGQSVFRTGLSKVGLPGTDVGIKARKTLRPPSTAQGPRGYTTASIRQEPLR